MIQQKDKNLNTRLIISIIISTIIVLSVLMYLGIINFLKPDSNYMAENAFLNLQDWELNSDKNINLDGEWEFYPEVLISPNDQNMGNNSFESFENIRKYVEVPKSWESYLDNFGSAEGSGTFRLIIKVPEDELYGIKIKTVRSAYRVFLNGNEVSSVGNPSLDRNKFVPDSKYKVAAGRSINKEIELVIQVSSYKYSTGGILKPIEFGTFASIMRQD